MTPFSTYQKRVLALLVFLQFTLILDFMLLSPLGALLMPMLHKVSGGLAASLAGMIIIDDGKGPLLHYDITGDVLMATTLLSALCVYPTYRQGKEKLA